MFDLGAAELLMIVIVAIIVIGPKDMPVALRTAGRWIGKMRRLSTHFRTGLDAMIREAEMEEMEKKWKAQNEKIMREHPETAEVEMEPTGALPSPAKTALPEGEKAGPALPDSAKPEPAASVSAESAAAKPADVEPVSPGRNDPSPQSAPRTGD